MRAISIALALLSIAAIPAQAEVIAAVDNGFSVSHTVSVSVDADAAFAMVRTPAKWWDKQHTWTGSSDNLYMDAQAGGCFCELIPNEATTESGAPQRTLRGSVQHMQIVYVEPGKMLRLSGALGPLQGEAMTGTLTISFKPVKGGTELTFDYVAGGYMRMAMGDIAPAVDGVIGQQASRLAMALGPMIGSGGGKAAPKADENAAEPAADAKPDADQIESLSDLVADLEPDADVTTGKDEPSVETSPMPPRAKPGSGPQTRRAPGDEPTQGQLTSDKGR